MQLGIHSALMAWCRITDAIFGATSPSFCVNQSSGNITELPEHKTHLLEISFNLSWNRMGKNLSGLGSGSGSGCAAGGVWAMWMSPLGNPSSALGVGSIGFSPALLPLGWVSSGVSLSWDLPLCRLLGTSLGLCDFTTSKPCRFCCL